jgi:hypothetical protein
MNIQVVDFGIHSRTYTEYQIIMLLNRSLAISLDGNLVAGKKHRQLTLKRFDATGAIDGVLILHGVEILDVGDYLASDNTLTQVKLRCARVSVPVSYGTPSGSTDNLSSVKDLLSEPLRIKPVHPMFRLRMWGRS